MATAKAPLFGLDASGTLGGSIVFSKWKGRNYIRRHSVPSNPQTGPQVGVRSMMRFISQDWKNLSGLIQGHWNDLGTQRQVTGLNAMLGFNIPRFSIANGPSKDYPNVPDASPSAPSTFTAVAGIKSAIITIANAGVTPIDYGWYIYQDKTTGFTIAPSNVVRVLPISTLVFRITGLDTGVPYFFRARGFSTGGQHGTASAEATCTPT